MKTSLGHHQCASTEALRGPTTCQALGGAEEEAEKGGRSLLGEAVLSIGSECARLDVIGAQQEGRDEG